MFCKECGREVSANKKFCTNCGAPISAPADNTYMASPMGGEGAESAYTATPTAKSGNSNSTVIVMLIVLIAVVVLLIGTVIGLYLYNNTNSEEDISEPQQTTEFEKQEPVEEPAEPIIEEPVEEPEIIKAPKEPVQGKSDNRKVKKEAFLKTAEEIEEYAEKSLSEAVSQSDFNVETGIIFAKWDDLLNEVYDYLETILPEDEFETLRNDELEWIKEKEDAIDATAKEWEGGSGAPAACNSVATDYTRERTYYLIYMID